MWDHSQIVEDIVLKVIIGHVEGAVLVEMLQGESCFLPMLVEVTRRREDWLGMPGYLFSVLDTKE
jgi:hypothetical protein